MQHLPTSVHTSQEIFYVNQETNIAEDRGIVKVVETNEMVSHHDNIPCKRSGVKKKIKKNLRKRKYFFKI